MASNYLDSRILLTVSSRQYTAQNYLLNMIKHWKLKSWVKEFILVLHSLIYQKHSTGWITICYFQNLAWLFWDLLNYYNTYYERNSHVSTWTIITTDVPQRSIIGPLLFIFLLMMSIFSFFLSLLVTILNNTFYMFDNTHENTISKWPDDFQTLDTWFKWNSGK